jgi:dipeptidyl aminopeptidase/acylaminoacyl peptidase
MQGLQMKHISFAVLGVTLAISTATAAPVVIHDRDHLAFSGKGLFADVEADDPGNLPDDPHGVVVVRDVKGKFQTKYDPCKDCKYSDLAWYYGMLAFVATDRKDGTATIFLQHELGFEPIACFKGVANTLRFSPDGLKLAALVTRGAHKMTGAVEAGAAQVGEIGTTNDEQRIVVIDVGNPYPNTYPLRFVSPADTYIYEYDWTPDGKNFVATAAKGNGDNNWWVATLNYIDGASGAMRRIAAPRMQIELPRVSPDGKTVAFIGGLMSDWQSIGGDLYTVPIAGGMPLNVTPNFKGSFRSIDWAGGRIMTGAIVDDRFAVGSVDPASHAASTSWSAPVSVRTQLTGAVQFSEDGSFAMLIAEDFNHAFEVYAGKLPNLAPVTHDNARLAANVSAESVHWTNQGFHLQGWLIGPKKTMPGVKHPMVVIVHGGPSSAYTPHYIAAGGQHGDNFDFAYDLIQKGYFIFYPNDRGSYGQGEAFTRANVKDFGGGDMRDMLAGVDAVEKIAPIDDARLGLYGHSYGGWFSMWADTQTKRFKAFVAGAGVANWTSYYGQNGIDQWMIPFFGASVYDDPAAYRASSPIEFIRSAKTPMLLYVGERDVECPAPQSLEYWHALKTIGTPTQLVIYAGEGHHFRKLTDLKDLRARIIGWFDRYLR